jgi:hypothetical protein
VFSTASASASASALALPLPLPLTVSKNDFHGYDLKVLSWIFHHNQIKLFVGRLDRPTLLSASVQ